MVIGTECPYVAKTKQYPDQGHLDISPLIQIDRQQIINNGITKEHIERRGKTYLDQ
jgi:hypothetical protein